MNDLIVCLYLKARNDISPQKGGEDYENFREKSKVNSTSIALNPNIDEDYEDYEDDFLEGSDKNLDQSLVSGAQNSKVTSPTGISLN